MYIRYLLALSVVVLSSCSMSNLFPSASTNPPVVGTGVNTGIPDINEIQSITVASGAEESVSLNMKDGVGFIKVVKGEGAKLKVFFSSDAGKTLTADLSTPGDTVANVRISQIIYPDGRSDGPFGRTMQYILSQTGQYQLILSESLMAGNPWAGEMDLAVKIQ